MKKILLAALFSTLLFASDFDRIDTISVNTPFWNVIGSTNDKKPRGIKSWIGLWRKYGGDSVYCVAQNSGRINCNRLIYGGHIVFDSAKVYTQIGDSSVYILPICNAHNNISNVSRMITKNNIIAVKLKNYGL